MTGTVKFRFPSNSLGIDLRLPQYTEEQVSYLLADNTRYRYDICNGYTIDL